MDLTTLLFGLRGRINRAKYWLVFLIVTGAVSLCLIVTAVMGGTEGISQLLSSDIFLLASTIILGWIGLAAGAKRLQDRNKGPWWLLLFFALPAVLDGIGTAFGEDSTTGLVFGATSLAIGLWAFIELACLKGTAGPNDYGADPLDRPPPLPGAPR